MTVCICREIKCPYFNDNVNGFGCQRWVVAGHCHLTQNPGVVNQTQYALYEVDGADLEKYKAANKKFFTADEKYKDDLDFVKNNKDWIEGWTVGKLPD